MSAYPSNPVPYQEASKNSDVLLIWLFMAAVFHAIILMGIHFTSPKPSVINKSIEVTLVHSATKKAPENAKYFAQANQIAAGLDDQKPMPVAKKHPKLTRHQKKQKQTESAKTQKAIEHRLITQKTAPKKLASAVNHENNDGKGENEKSQPELSMEELDKQIALLEAKLEHQQEASEKTRIKSLNAISAHKQLAAQYIKDWETKVQRVGNLNYPEINGKKDFSGIVTLDVGINTDGTVYDTHIIKSSGIPALDEAAKKIVSDNAPFEPLPDVITQELDVLRIRREFVFSDESLSTSMDN